MTNNQIIINALACNDLLTDEILEDIKIGILPPYHTFADWKQRGYSVKKGEKAALCVSLWKPVKCKQELDEESEIQQPAQSKMRLVKSYLFSKEQVEKKQYGKTADEVRAYNAMMKSQRQ